MVSLERLRACLYPILDFFLSPEVLKQKNANEISQQNQQRWDYCRREYILIYKLARLSSGGFCQQHETGWADLKIEIYPEEETDHGKGEYEKIEKALESPFERSVLDECHDCSQQICKQEQNGDSAKEH